MMDYKAIPLKGTEYLYTYRNSQQISGQTGLVGYLRADFGSSDNGFFNTWNEFRADYNMISQSSVFADISTRITSKSATISIISANLQSEWKISGLHTSPYKKIVASVGELSGQIVHLLPRQRR